MSARCTVCTHDELEEIDAALVTGSTLRDIARRYGVSKDAASRHKAHVSRALSQVVAARQQAGSKTALDRIEHLHDRAMRVLDTAEAEGKASLSLAAVRELRSLVELIAKITGELDERSTVQVLNVATAPEWVAIRAAVMAALIPHPDAAAAVVERLAALEVGSGPLSAIAMGAGA